VTSLYALEMPSDVADSSSFGTVFADVHCHADLLTLPCSHRVQFSIICDDAGIRVATCVYMILELICLLLHLTRIHKSLHGFIADVVVIFLTIGVYLRYL